MYLSTPVSPYFCIPLYLYDCISLSLYPSCISVLSYPRPQYTFILLASCILLSLYSCIFVSQYCCNTLDCIPLSFYFVFLYPVECRLCPQNSLGWFLSDWAKAICQLYFYLPCVYALFYVTICLNILISLCLLIAYKSTFLKSFLYVWFNFCLDTLYFYVFFVFLVVFGLFVEFFVFYTCSNLLLVFITLFLLCLCLWT